MSSSVEALEPHVEELTFSCPDCGKRYSTPGKNAGRRLRCRRCTRRVRVPGRRVESGRISDCTRAAVLADLGLDPTEAEEAYWRRQLDSFAEQPRPAIPQSEPRRPTEPPPTKARPALPLRKAPPGLEKSLGYWAFVSIGVGGFLHTLCAVPPRFAVPVAIVLAAVGARAVFLAAERKGLHAR